MAKTNHDPLSRPPLERIFEFHNLIQAGKYPNCSTLARRFEVHVRTINRDLDFMRDRLVLPIEYDDKRRGYYYTKPVDNFPLVPMTEAEIFALLVAHKAISQYEGTPFERPLHTAFRKLSGQLDDQTTVSMPHPDEVLSFRPFGPEVTDLEDFQTLTRAVTGHRVLKFSYRKLGLRTVHSRIVHPYHLSCVKNQWYLFAFDLQRKEMRTFALARLENPELTGESFKLPAKFDLNKHLQNSFGVFRGNNDYEVVINLDFWATDLIRMRRWHSSQNLVELPEGCSQLTLRLNSLEEVSGWVLGLGEHATVVRPKALVDMVYKSAKAVVVSCEKTLCREPKNVRPSEPGPSEGFLTGI